MLKGKTVWFASAARDAYSDIQKWWSRSGKKHAYPPVNLLAVTNEHWLKFLGDLEEEVLLFDDTDSETVLITGVGVAGRGDRLQRAHADRLRALTSELRGTPRSWRLGIQVEEGDPTQELLEQFRQILGNGVQFRSAGAGKPTARHRAADEALLRHLLEESSLPTVGPGLEKDRLLARLHDLANLNLRSAVGARADADPRTAPERWVKSRGVVYEAGESFGCC